MNEEEEIDINSIDLDKLQQSIANIAENTDNSTENILQNPMEIMEQLPDKPEEPAEEEKETETITAEEETESDSPYKKYVLKINKKYREIIDKMSIEEREQYFNAMLEFYISNQSSIEKKFRLKDALVHILIVVITTLIGLPLIFFFANKSMEITVSNYKQTQTNFVNLYRDKGGLKKKDLSKLRNLK